MTDTSTASALLPAWRARIDERLMELLPEAAPGDGVAAAMRDTVLSPGKRLRPLLVLAAGHAFRPDLPGLLDAACAVEMVHGASLALDDMPCMDDAQVRRGRPTVHRRHGEDAAALAVVALVAHACGTLAALPGADGELRARLVRVLCDAIGAQGLARGQYHDLRQGASARTREAIAQANEQKTGLLFACAFELGALVAGAPQAVPGLRKAALELGHAFQLRDDLDDAFASADELRKDVLQDAGKTTLVSMLGRSAVERQLLEHLCRAEAGLQEVLPDTGLLLALLRYAFAAELGKRRQADPAPAGIPLVSAPSQSRSQDGLLERPVH
jgi:geranylgeranyl diphosphate synthase type II